MTEKETETEQPDFVHPSEAQFAKMPGVTIVPAMVIAIEKAQAAGIRYNKQ